MHHIASRRILSAISSCLLLVACTESVFGQEPVPDLEYSPQIETPEYVQNGPSVHIDEAHRNYHTFAGRYSPFAKLLERDGYRTKAFTARFSFDSLQETDILVVANAMSDGAGSGSAFSAEEIIAIREWVRAGGSLLLIADHPPFSTSVKDLAEAFGFQAIDGAVLQQKPGEPLSGQISFERGAGLTESLIANGRSQSEKIDRVVTFTGSAWVIPPSAISILTFSKYDLSYSSPDEDAERIPVEGRSQGAIAEISRGKVAIFGEAAMFTAQRAGPKMQPVGMNSPSAPQNFQFVLNLMHWLSDATNMSKLQ